MLTLPHATLLQHIASLRRAYGSVAAHKAEGRVLPGGPAARERQQGGVHARHGIADLTHQRSATVLQRNKPCRQTTDQSPQLPIKVNHQGMSMPLAHHPGNATNHIHLHASQQETRPKPLKVAVHQV